MSPVTLVTTLTLGLFSVLSMPCVTPASAEVEKTGQQVLLLCVDLVQSP